MGGTTVLTSGKALQNLTGISSSGTITFGGLNSAGVVHTNGSGTLSTGDVALGSETSGSFVANLGSLTGLSTTGNGGEGSTPTLSVTYGSGANTAAQGNTSLSFSGGGNLTGTVSGTAGGGFTANTLDIVSNPTFSGLLTGQANTIGLALTGTPNNNGTSSLLQLGSAIASGNNAANGGTYLGLNAPNTGAGSAADFLNFQVNGTSKLKVDNTGLIDSKGGLAINGTTVITSGRVLQNVTLDTASITSGILAASRGGTGLDGSGATNGQLLIGNGSGFSLGSLANNGGLTISTGAGTLGLAVNYGSSSTSAVRGDTSLTCPSGTGNLSGGGGTITLGSGGSCGNISISNSPTFTTSVTTPSLISSSGLAISSGGSGDITFDSASNKIVIAADDTTLQHVASGNYTFDLKDSGLTKLVLDNSGTGAADLNLNDGSLEIAGTTVLTNARVLQNVTFSAGLVTSGTLSAANGGTGLNGSGATNGQLLIGNGSGFSLGSLANNGGLTVSTGAGTLGLAVNYGSSSTSAVRGDTTLTCPSGTGNLTGGGTSITLGSGGSCASIDTNAAVSFGTSVTTPLITNNGGLTINTANSTTVNTGAITIQSGNASSGSNLSAGTLTFDTGTKTGAGTATINIGNTNATSLVLGNSNTATTLSGTSLTLGSGLSTISRTAAGTTTLDFKDGSNTIVAFTNSGAGNVNLTTDGTITAGNGLTVSASGASISGGLNNNSGGITNAGSITGIGTNLTASAGLTIASGGSGDLTIDSASNKLVIAADDTTLQRVASGSYTVDLKDTGATTLVLDNSGTGAASLNLNDGGLQVAGTSVLTNGRALQNLTGITNVGTFTTSGGAVLVNDNSNFTAGINTGTSTGTITIGGGSAPLVIDSTNFDVSSGGGLSGITGYTQASGNFAISGSGTFSTGTGAISLNGATTVQVDSTGALVTKSSGGTAVLSANTTGLVVIVGSTTTDTNQILLSFDSFNTFADTASCTTTTNQGAVYYNTKSNAVRGCVNGAWEDMVSSGALGLQLFGVVPDTGANPGDVSSVTGGGNGPCKVSWASTTTVNISACVAFSGGRKVIVAAQTGTSVAGNGTKYICLQGTDNQPNVSATLPGFSAGSPVLCLSEVVVQASAIADMYDTRTFTTTAKEFTTINSTSSPGMPVVWSAAKVVVTTNTSGAAKVRGVIVATSGAASSTTINGIIATNGTQWVRANAGTAGDYVETINSTGFAATAANAPAPANGAYANLGIAQTAFSTTCSSSTNCEGSLLLNMSLR